MAGSTMDALMPVDPSPTQNPRWVPVGLALLLALLSFGLGVSNLGVIVTGGPAESQTFREALQLVAGNQRWGIVEYTHYPNGPVYVVSAMMALGISPHAMRFLPIGVAAMSFGLLFWSLWITARSWSLRVWAALGCLVLALQPGIVLWQGALHEHSYALSLGLATIGLSCVLRPSAAWALYAIGFTAGWIGYDFLPAQTGAVFTARWLYHGRADDKGQAPPLADAFGWAVLDALRFASGAAGAILAHVIQVVLFYGGLEAALRDFVGSAAARLGADAGTINPAYEAHLRIVGERMAFRPEYSEFSRAALGAEGVRNTRMLAKMAELFFTRETDRGLLLTGVGAGLAIAAVEMARTFARGGGKLSRALPRLLASGAVALAGTLAASIAWMILVPRHAVFHFHILPRHFFIGCGLLVLLPVALAWRRPEKEPGPPGFHPAAWPRVGIHVAVPLFLAAGGLYALLRYG